MFQRSVTRAALNVSRARVVSVVSRASVSHPIRFNSTQSETPETPASKPTKTSEQIARKKELERKDDLQRDWDARIITYDDFLVKTQNPSEDAYIIDVREPDEVVQGMIPSAVNLPLSVLGPAVNMGRQTFKEKFGFEKPQRGQEVTFYCRSGKRSSTAADVAKRNGYTNVLNYKGSWLEWVSKQTPTPSESSEPSEPSEPSKKPSA